MGTFNSESSLGFFFFFLFAKGWVFWRGGFCFLFFSISYYFLFLFLFCFFLASCQPLFGKKTLSLSFSSCILFCEIKIGKICSADELITALSFFSCLKSVFTFSVNSQALPDPFQKEKVFCQRLDT